MIGRQLGISPSHPPNWMHGRLLAGRWSRLRNRLRIVVFGRRAASGALGHGDGFTAYQHLIEKWGVSIIIAKSLTPIPFKIMAIAAGVAGMSPSAFLASGTVGRALHFAIVATLISY
jgi:membrane protein YqaA with SNARE-associated domain